MDDSLGCSVGKYHDPETGRYRWAVICGSVWYFANRHGLASARALCRRMNKGEFHGNV